MEEIVAIGRVWHTACFTCGGGKGEGGCGKTLPRTGYLDHNAQPYCASCHGKLFGPKGFGYGNTLNNTGMVAGEDGKVVTTTGGVISTGKCLRCVYL